ncbi:hypothetical protein [Rurimicrobium arvi]|uniref:Outer membrane beta-barrel protein n=1 Tax=Rurimicrobium arvi TaxID=2049916 RepID=A0ABP8MQU2_9BACT
MKTKLISSFCTTALALGFAFSASAQLDREYIERRCWSLGVKVGTGDLWGDVGTKSPIEHFKNSNYSSYIQPFGGLYVRYSSWPALVMRTGISYGIVSAGDKMNKDLAEKETKYETDAVQRYQRNLDVRTTIWEGSFMFEINPFRISPLSRAAKMHFQPYLLAGIAGYHFNAKGRYVEKDGSAGASTGEWIDLYDLHVEGDGFKESGMPKAYSQWQLAIPLGIGIKWDLSPSFGIGAEWVYRKCFTDYLDGVSQNYIDPALYAQNGLTPAQVKQATAMRDKSWELDPNKTHKTGEMRGSNKGPDGFSSFSITFFYKFKTRAEPWWEE